MTDDTPPDERHEFTISTGTHKCCLPGGHSLPHMTGEEAAAEIERLQADNVRMANVLAHPIMRACIALNPQIPLEALSNDR